MKRKTLNVKLILYYLRILFAAFMLSDNLRGIINLHAIIF